jgi:hypothetical protein
MTGVPAINDLGVIAGLVTGVGPDRLAIFENGVEGTLISVGSPFDGSTVRGMAFSPEGFNNLNQIAFLAELSDGRSVVVLATVPEPGSLTMLLVIGGGPLDATTGAGTVEPASIRGFPACRHPSSVFSWFVHPRSGTFHAEPLRNPPSHLTGREIPCTQHAASWSSPCSHAPPWQGARWWRRMALRKLRRRGRIITCSERLR